MLAHGSLDARVVCEPLEIPPALLWVGEMLQRLDSVERIGALFLDFLPIPCLVGLGWSKAAWPRNLLTGTAHMFHLLDLTFCASY